MYLRNIASLWPQVFKSWFRHFSETSVFLMTSFVNAPKKKAYALSAYRPRVIPMSRWCLYNIYIYMRHDIGMYWVIANNVKLIMGPCQDTKFIRCYILCILFVSLLFHSLILYNIFTYTAYIITYTINKPVHVYCDRW